MKKRCGEKWFHRWGPREWHDSVGHYGVRYLYRACRRCGAHGGVYKVGVAAVCGPR